MEKAIELKYKGNKQTGTLTVMNKSDLYKITDSDRNYIDLDPNGPPFPLTVRILPATAETKAARYAVRSKHIRFIFRFLYLMITFFPFTI